MESEPIISGKGRELRDEVFGKRVDAVEENSNRPLKELVDEAQKMVADGKTYTVLVKQGQLIHVNGVPCTVARLKGQHLTVIPVAGYKLLKDTPSNRASIGYVEIDSQEEKEKGK